MVLIKEPVVRHCSNVYYYCYLLIFDLCARHSLAHRIHPSTNDTRLRWLYIANVKTFFRRLICVYTKKKVIFKKKITGNNEIVRRRRSL